MHAVSVFFDMKYSNIKAWLKISRTNKYWTIWDVFPNCSLIVHICILIWLKRLSLFIIHRYFHYSCHSPRYKCSAERATLFANDIPLLFAPHVCCPHIDHPIYLGKSKNVSSAENWLCYIWLMRLYNVQYSLFFVLEWSWP